MITLQLDQGKKKGKRREGNQKLRSSSEKTIQTFKNGSWAELWHLTLRILFHILKIFIVISHGTKSKFRWECWMKISFSLIMHSYCFTEVLKPYLLPSFRRTHYCVHAKQTAQEIIVKKVILTKAIPLLPSFLPTT